MYGVEQVSLRWWYRELGNLALDMTLLVHMVPALTDKLDAVYANYLLVSVKSLGSPESCSSCA